MAKQIVHDYTMNPPSIRQRTVYVQFSNHKALKTDGSPSQQVSNTSFIRYINTVSSKSGTNFCNFNKEKGARIMF